MVPKLNLILSSTVIKIRARTESQKAQIFPLRGLEEGTCLRTEEYSTEPSIR